MSELIFEKEGHKYFRDGKERVSVSKIIEVGGFVDLSMVPEATLAASSHFGHVLHDTCRLHDLGRLKSCDPIIEPYLNGWKKFIKDHSVKFLLIEKPLDSKVWDYAGTPDRVCVINDVGVLADIKSGVIEKYHELQICGGYEILVEENKIIKIRKRWRIKLMPNDYRIIPLLDVTAKAVFIGAVQGYHWKKRNGRLK